MADFNDVPFNFVPLNHEVFIPDWGDKISQDIPFKDGEDGIISFTIRNISPLFIRDGINSTESAYVIGSDGRKRYFIPGSSIKGMIRSTLEIMSFGKMQQYNDDFFGYRDFGGNRTSLGKRFVEAMAQAKCGWLYVEGGEYKLEECGSVNDHDIVPIRDIQQRYRCYNGKTGAADKAEAFKSQENTYYPLWGNNKRLVCSGTGIPGRTQKANERLIPESSPQHSVRIVPSDVVEEKFLTIYKPNDDYYQFIVDILRKGEKLGVFYTTCENGEVEAIGITRNFRYPHKFRVSDGIKHQQSGFDQNGHPIELEYGKDLAECIFGKTSTEKGESLKGRVQIGNAFAEPDIRKEQSVKGILGQPKASYYPYYLKQENGATKYKTYSDSPIEISGRKRYRTHSNLSQLPQPQPDRHGNVKENDKVTTTFTPLSAECKFLCEIRLHNMKPEEIGAILSALTFHDTKDCHHNIGLAKPMGYGKLDISNIQLEYLSNSDKNFYMKAFEDCMTDFLSKASGKRWLESEQLKMLAAIASDHANRLEYMSLGEYGDSKKNGAEIRRLQENSIPDIRPIGSKESEKEMIELYFSKIQKKIEFGDLDEASRLCDDLENFVPRYNGEELRTLISEKVAKFRRAIAEKESSLISAKFDEIGGFIDNNQLEDAESLCNELSAYVPRYDTNLSAQIKQRVENLRGKIRKARAEEKQAEGLASTLDERNLNGEYIVREFKLLSIKINKWLKDAGREHLSSEEVNALRSTLRRIYDDTHRERDRRDWQNIDNRNTWGKLRGRVSEEELQDLYNSTLNK